MRSGLCTYIIYSPTSRKFLDTVQIPELFQIKSPNMPESSPVQLSVRYLTRDIKSGKKKVGEDTKTRSKNTELLQRIFKSQETSILEVMVENLVRHKLFPH
jgi:hypothetical protein